MTLLLVAELLVVGCGEDSVCAPGDSKPCTCPGGASGGQTCAADGTRWEKCVCGAGEGEGEGAGNAGIEWVRLEGGRFNMGSEDAVHTGGRALPVHAVYVPTFELARTEVTVAQYRACVQAGACTEPEPNVFAKCRWGVEGGDAYPVNCVDWEQARAFSAWAGGRLPSEAEWEYAARSGGRDQTYPWGDEQATCERAVMDDCPGYPQPVCSKPAGNSAEGLCDLAGNVAEWVEDCYHLSYNEAPADGGAWVDGCVEANRGVRGGSWDALARYCRAAARRRSPPSSRRDNVGFRPSRSP